MYYFIYRQVDYIFINNTSGYGGRGGGGYNKRSVPQSRRLKTKTTFKLAHRKKIKGMLDMHLEPCKRNKEGCTKM